MGGRIFAVGGHGRSLTICQKSKNSSIALTNTNFLDGKNYLNTVEAFDPLTSSWYPVSSISQCRLVDSSPPARVIFIFSAGAGITWSGRTIDEIRCIIPREKKKERTSLPNAPIFSTMNTSSSGLFAATNPGSSR
jgi:hypothetical protein